MFKLIDMALAFRAKMKAKKDCCFGFHRSELPEELK